MIDSDAMVFNPCARLIIPEGVAVRLAMAGAKRVRKPQMQDATESRARFGLKKGISCPRSRVIAIVRGRNDVVIPGENQRFLMAQEVADMPIKPLQPGQLIGESLRTRR